MIYLNHKQPFRKLNQSKIMSFLISFEIIENHTVIASKTKPSDIIESHRDYEFLKSKSFKFDKK